MQTTIDKEDTIQRALNLDMNALGVFFDRFYPLIYDYIIFRICDEGISSELTHQVFIRLLETIQKNKITQPQLPTWLYSTAAKLVDDLPRHTHQPSPTRGNQPDHSPASALDEIEWLKSVVHQSLHRLTPDHQHLLALRFSQSLALEEVARLTGKSIADIRQLQYDALHALRLLLEQNT